jgi:prevent-host-death family protein
VKVIGLDVANLKKCVRDAQQEGVVLTRKGKPVALLVSVKGFDLEQLELGQSDEFWTLRHQRRTEKTMSRAELEHQLAEQK